MISNGELGRLLDWFIDGLFVDIFISFCNILHEFVGELIRDDINGDWVIELEFTCVKSNLRWEGDKNELLYCDTVVLFFVLIGRHIITDGSEHEMGVLEDEEFSSEDWLSDDREELELFNVTPGYRVQY